MVIGPEIITWLKESLLIFFLTFLQEEVAILFAAFSNVEQGLPFLFTYVPVFLGIVAGDISLYGLGRLARRNQWLSSLIIGPKVEQIRLWLQSWLIRVFIISRLSPGILFPAFVACGWFKIPFRRFILISFVTGTLYSTLLLTLVILFGDLVLVRFGYWSWAILALLVLIWIIRNTILTEKRKASEMTLDETPPSIIEVMKRYLRFKNGTS